MTAQRYRQSEMIGVAVICTAAAGLHAVCGLTQGGTLAIIFGAVNESVWEHVKIVSLGYAGWALLQLLWARVPLRRYAVAKCCGLYLLMLGMIGSSALCAALAGRPVPLADGLSAAALIPAVQLGSCVLTLRWRTAGDCFAPAVLLLMLYYLMFFAFTVSAPPLWLFCDPFTGRCGIPA